MSSLDYRLRPIELQLCNVIREMNMCANALVNPPVSELEMAGVASILVKLSGKLGMLRDEVKNIRTEGGSAAVKLVAPVPPQPKEE